MSGLATTLLVAQWTALIALALIVLGLARQIGVLHRRLGPAGALMLSKSVKVGEKSPELRFRTLDSTDIVIGEADPAGRATLIMFVAPDCPVCARIMPVVKTIARSEERHLRIVFASDGDPQAQYRYRAEKGLESFPYVLSAELGMRFEIGKLPYAVLLDRDGVVVGQGLVNTREHIESLFEAHRMKVASIQDYLGTADPGLPVARRA